MQARILFRLAREGRLRLLAAASRVATPHYRVAWLAAAARYGVLARLAEGPVAFERLAAELARGPQGPDALRAWLQVGERLGELRSTPRGWVLRGFLARRLAEPENDAVAAICEEAASLHHALLLDGPERLRRGEPWTLADQDGVLIARSSRVLEPLVFEAVDAFIPRSGPVSLLEVGPGSGVYIRHAAERNSELRALGLELQEEVAALAMQNLRAWGLAARARIETGDVRKREPEAAFDRLTLHNNIYYFPVEERVVLLAHLRRFLVPGGRLLLTTGCQGGSVGMALLNLWSASTRGCGPLPEPAELVEQLGRAGFATPRSARLLPGESYFAFTGVNPGGA